MAIVSIIIEGCAEGCFSVFFEIIAQVVIAIFYYAIIAPIGGIGRMLPLSAHHRHGPTHTSELGPPFKWGFAGLLIVGVTGGLIYWAWGSGGLVALLIPVALVILLGWLGVWEQAKAPLRKAAKYAASKPERPRQARAEIPVAEVPSFRASSTEVSRAEVPTAEVPTPPSNIERKEKWKE